MWWDIYYRKRPSETRGITGVLLDTADELGVAEPLNRRTAEMIYEIEAGKRAPGVENIDELYEYARAENLLLP